jgi:short-subunit dehydrogenase
MPADLAKAEDLAAVEQRISGAPELALLVNNAGFGALGRFSGPDLESQDRMHRLHIMATMRLTHAALQGMVARDRGGVINVSSVAAFTATPGGVSYHATKAWINHFTEALALELAAAGSRVRVQALCPGFTYTEFHDVMGMDRKVVPRGWWMQAEQIVAASLSGLERGQLIVVPGLRYRLLVIFMALIPGFLRRALVKGYAKRTKRF